ncbi:MAG: hypothetical protein QXN75_04710 [Thermoproteota archaeon]|nr:hypothetical protein [Candidatus Brockarchaeota archaeon]
MGVEITPGEKAGISSLLNRSDVQALLRAFMDGSISVLKPVLNQNGDFSYPEAEKIMGSSSRVAREILEALSNEGILLKELTTAVLSCPQCGCSKFIVELTDTYSPSSSRSKVIENIVSGLLGKRLVCISGNHSFYENEGVSRKIYSFRFNPDKRDLVGRWLLDITPVIESLRAKGWRVESPAKIRGKSGVEHTFSLAVSYKGELKDGVDAVVDIIVSDILVDESALSIVLKAMDVNAAKKLLLVVPGLTDKARTLFDYYNTFDVYVLECQNVSQINNALFEILMSLAKIRLKTVQM